MIYNNQVYKLKEFYEKTDYPFNNENKFKIRLIGITYYQIHTI